MQAAPVEFTEPSKPSTLPAMPLVTFCMIFEIRKRIAREDRSGTGHADALGRAWGIRLRFLVPPPLPRLLFIEATDGKLERIGGSPSPAGAAPPPAGEADGTAAGAPDAPPDVATGPPAAQPSGISGSSQHQDVEPNRSTCDRSRFGG
jgi:hypothetical protein